VKSTALIACALTLLARPALAQPPTEPSPPSKPAVRDSTSPPLRTLFPEPQMSPDARQSLLLRAVTYGAYDDNLVAALNSGPDQHVPEFGGGYSGFNTRMAYRRQTPRGTTFGITATGNGVYAPSINDSMLAGYTVESGVGVTLKAWRVHATGAVDGSPYYRSFVTFPESFPEYALEETSKHFDEAIAKGHGLLARGGVIGTREVTRRNSVEVRAEIHRDTYESGGSGDNRDAEVFDQRAAFIWKYAVGRNVWIDLGYGYRYGHVQIGAEERPIREHDIDIGIGLDKALSPSRRTRLTVLTGQAVIANQSLFHPIESSDARSGYSYVTLADAQITRDIGRTWSAAGRVTRDVQNLTGFLDPFIANTASLTAGGFLRSRLHARILTQYSSGSVTWTDQSAYDAVNGSARLTILANRSLGVFGEYVLYRYHFGASLDRPAGIPQSFRRQGVRVGLMLALPLLRTPGVATP
jgi:hypothetical protein